MELPFAVIDFEASSLSLSAWPEISSYPIEAGVTIAGTGGSILTWSSLIRPPTAWTAKGEWDKRSARIHGIERSDLFSGRPPADVVAELNTMLGPYGEAWCDNERYDRHWLDVLYATVGMEPAFRLRDISGFPVHTPTFHEDFADLMADQPCTHRAGPDSAQICAALLKLAGRAPEGRASKGRGSAKLL